MTEFGREYGEALYSLCAEEGLTEQVWQELRCLQGIFGENPDFIRLLGNLLLNKEERVAILDAALKGQVHPYVLNFLRILVERGAIHTFRECVAAYEAGYNRDYRIVEAQVTTARPLTDVQREKLTEKIRAMTGKQPVLREKVDPALLGGVLLEMEGKRYDNTVHSRLTAIRQAMTEAQ